MSKPTRNKPMNEQLDASLLIAYKNIMSGIYKAYAGQYPSEYIRLRFLSLITNHICEQTVEHMKSQEIKVEQVKQIKILLKNKEHTV